MASITMLIYVDWWFASLKYCCSNIWTPITTVLTESWTIIRNPFATATTTIRHKERLMAIILLLLWSFVHTHYSYYIPKSYSLRNRVMAAVVDPILYGIDHQRYRAARRKAYGKKAIYINMVHCFDTADQIARKERQVRFDCDAVTVGIDNRCSGCISHKATDFVGRLRRTDKTIKGFGGITTFKVMQGTLNWKWCDDDGKEYSFLIRDSYYIPQGGVRLLSPQHWAQTRPTRTQRESAGEWTGKDTCTLKWNDGKRMRETTVPIDVRGNNLATFELAPGYEGFNSFCVDLGVNEGAGNDILYEANPIEVNETHLIPDDEEEPEVRQDPESIPEDDGEAIKFRTEKADTQREFQLGGPRSSDPQTKAPVVVTDEEDRPGEITPTSELLQYHYKFQHISFQKLQIMAREGVIPKRLAKCNVPLCTACSYAKATKRPWRSKTTNKQKEAKDGGVSEPGHVISVDQLVSPVPGLIAQMTGFLTRKRYKYATVFVDQHSRLGYVFLQKTCTAEETIEAKRTFEQYAANRGVTVRAYHADNGVFKANDFVNECRSKGQPLTFAGVNAHHQNGMAERRIRELQELTRTSLIHANRRWPNATTANLWPYALRMACLAYNSTPSLQDAKRRTPEQVFAKSEVSINKKHWKPFGCPVYVLDNDLQQGKSHPKWSSRSRVGIYMGQSPIHNHNVALVMDPISGYVSPQFHVKFDPSFYTVRDGVEVEIKWRQATGFLDTKNRGAKSKKDTVKVNKRKRVPEKAKRGDHKRNKVSEGVHRGSTTDDTPSGMRSTNPDAAKQDNASDQRKDNTEERRPSTEETIKFKDHTEAQDESVRRSARVHKPTQRLLQSMMTEIEALTADGIPGEIFCSEVLNPDNACYTDSSLLAYKASTDPDTMYMHEAMKEPDHKEFLKAMEKEVKDQMDNGNFTIVRRDSVPKGTAILPTVWQMKRKRDIVTQQVKKYKARLNIDGSRMKHGIHYEQTYAPVASWMSVKLLLALSTLHDWHSVQIDYVLAFPQAPVEKELYMECPRGFQIKDVGDPKEYVLKLHRNVYGQKQAGRVWYQYLTNKLVKEVGFERSEVDECIFYKGNVIYVLYTDDSILTGPDKGEIDQVIRDIRAAGLDITEEGDIKDFLGVHITKKDGKITFAQPHLIDKVLKTIGMNGDNVKPADTPARSSVPILRHSKSPDFNKSFNYRSVIGMLGYLETTRSDIAYTSHQCARFSTAPKVEHEKAIRHLGRYLAGTRDKGTVFEPDFEKGLEVYVDADFMGNWDATEANQDRDTARSRHGYIISYAGCPLVTKSQLQTEVCLSTTESEYTGLSYALREAIPIMRLLDEMKERGVPITKTGAVVKCKVYEDNSGALEIANNPKYRPRTKHLNGRLHHFRSWVESKRITIEKIHTKEQRADYLTKAVPVDILTHLRKQVMGW